MVDTQFSLEWDSHSKNICSGLSSLQQNGEFVDMTLAADGHHVKVHQIILALASPYIKELVTSANCPHPIIFLNKMSYKTLCSILEYIYTGQTQVAVDDISELITAARELHIKGLEDVKSGAGVPSVSETEMNTEVSVEMPEIQIKLQRPDVPTPTISNVLSLKRKLDIGLKKVPSNMPLRKRTILNTDRETPKINKDPDLTKDGGDAKKPFGFDDPLDVDDRDDDVDEDNNDNDYSIPVKKAEDNSTTSVQYTVSNQGSLQLVLNRFLYFVFYQYRDKSRQWRCVDNYRKNKCMASVFTKNNVVIRRVGVHNHPFHDKIILKKVRAGSIYAALQEAEAKSTKQPRMRVTHPKEK